MGGLRARIHTAEEELLLLRRAELSEASEKQRKAAIDGVWNGGGLRRFLHPPSPALHSAALQGEVVTSLTITEVQPSLARTLHGSGTSISHDGPDLRRGEVGKCDTLFDLRPRIRLGPV